MAASYQVKTRQEVAAFFGLSLSAIQKWTEEGMPAAENGYDLSAVAVWRLSISRGGRGTPGGKAAEIIEIAKARKLSAEAEACERRNKIAAGLLIPRDDVEQEVAEMILATKQDLLALPTDLMMRFPESLRASIVSEMERKIGASLTRLAEWWKPRTYAPSENGLSELHPEVAGHAP